jgi:hypothetical protein
MLRIITAYALALVLGPSIALISQLLFAYPIGIGSRKFSILKLPLAFLLALTWGLICFSVGGYVFVLFDLDVTIWLLFLYLFFTISNNNQRLKSPFINTGAALALTGESLIKRDKVIEVGYYIGDIAGLLIGAYLFGMFG